MPSSRIPPRSPRQGSPDRYEWDRFEPEYGVPSSSTHRAHRTPSPVSSDIATQVPVGVRHDPMMHRGPESHATEYGDPSSSTPGAHWTLPVSNDIPVQVPVGTPDSAPGYWHGQEYNVPPYSTPVVHRTSPVSGGISAQVPVGAPYGATVNRPLGSYDPGYAIPFRTTPMGRIPPPPFLPHPTQLPFVQNDFLAQVPVGVVYEPVDPFWPASLPHLVVGQVYSNCLLRLPSAYFSRVARVFRETEMTISQIKEMAVEMSDPVIVNSGIHHPLNSKLKETWESFVKALVREWTTMNVVSTVLLPTMVTILQIQCAAADPIARHVVLFSLLSASFSLLYGIILMTRFEDMKKPVMAAEWAMEAENPKSGISWNLWIMLAMPAIWLAWAAIFFVVFLALFSWRTSSATCADASFRPLSPAIELGLRIMFSSVLMLGAVYLALILITLSGSGDPMRRDWGWRYDGWGNERALYRRKYLQPVQKPIPIPIRPPPPVKNPRPPPTAVPQPKSTTVLPPGLPPLKMPTPKVPGPRTIPDHLQSRTTSSSHPQAPAPLGSEAPATRSERKPERHRRHPAAKTTARDDSDMVDHQWIKSTKRRLHLPTPLTTPIEATAESARSVIADFATPTHKDNGVDPLSRQSRPMTRSSQSRQ